MMMKQVGQGQEDYADDGDHNKAGIDESQKSKFESRKRNLKF